ncbi:hypothetical protein, variant 3 [Aphanomyces astaci]|uniref:HECT-type E3 ubiquitin transferase n=1 Tax=Aphanomyces astaci TaxID=112090 RepID=W4FNR5_APHAT|nr:hypothetical protein, variant 3 [Aphanomyces astaci]ETV68489.1 hypothetical protein, variant 3 [Aphanomyces astaci]|eukprot:XP_009842114.1 hypothetical protein, variant 3 [Aphanomyces astaci]
MATPSREKAARNILKQRHVTPYKMNNRDALIKQRECGWNDHYLLPLQPSDEASAKAKNGTNYVSASFTDLPGPENQNHLRSGGFLNKAKNPRPRKTPPNGKLEPIQADHGDAQLRRRAVASIEYREEIIKQLSDFITCIPVKVRQKGHVHVHGAKPHQSLPANLKPKDITNIIKQISTELQVAGIRCVESIVAWMLHQRNASETPPVFVWKQQNYFVHMYSDLDFLVDELRSRGIPIPPEFTKSNPLLVNSNQRLGRVCAAQSIVVEMVEMAKVHHRPSPSSPPTSKLSTPPSAQRARNNSRSLVRGDVGSGSNALVNSTSSVDKSQENSTPTTTRDRECVLDLMHSETGALHQDVPCLKDDSKSSLRRDISHEGATSNAQTHLQEPPAPDASFSQDNNSHANLGSIQNQEMHALDEAIQDTLPSHPNHDIPAFTGIPVITRYPAPRNHDEGNNQPKSHPMSWQESLANIPIPASAIAALSSCLEPNEWNSTSVLHILHDSRAWFAADLIGIVCVVDQNLRIVCASVLDVIDTAMAQLLVSLQCFVQSNSCSAAEIEVDDILDALTSSVHPPDVLVSMALEVAQQLAMVQPSMVERLRSPKSAELLRYLYPFIMSDKSKASSCCQMFAMLAPIVDFAVHPYLLDYLGKGMLVMANISIDSTLSKLSIVCDRTHPLTTSIHSIDDATGWNSLFDLYPFFASAYGEKMVNHTLVEAGEGRGPLKEWFSLVWRELSSSWARSSSLPTPNRTLTIHGRTVHAPNMVDTWGVQTGHRVDVTMPNRASTSCRVVQLVDGNSVVVDQTLSTDDVVVDSADLTWFTPQAPIFLYIQDSESYFLNEVTAQARTKDLEFVGWLVAMAMFHQVTLECRLNVVWFDLLLGAELTLSHIHALDPSLHSSWTQLSSMDNLHAFLEMEELPATMTAVEYVNHALQVKATTFAWQIHAVRRGFTKVLPLAGLKQCMMSPQDFQFLVHGEIPSE